MRLFSYFTVFALGVFSPWMAHACERGPDDKAFDKIAPTSSEIIAVQVLSLSLETDPREPTTYSQEFRGKIRVLKHFRGSSDFEEITYRNSHCGGLRIDVSGIYIIATNSTTSTIELSAYDAPILHIPAYTFDAELVLRSFRVFERLEAAIRGEGSFAITTPDMRAGLFTEAPPPPVPPPAEIGSQQGRRSDTRWTATDKQ